MKGGMVWRGNEAYKALLFHGPSVYSVLRVEGQLPSSLGYEGKPVQIASCNGYLGKLDTFARHPCCCGGHIEPHFDEHNVV